MTVWIIAYSVDGNTHTLKAEADHKLSMEEAVERLTREAEQHYEEQEFEADPGQEQTPAMLLYERFGITITGISEA